MFSLICAWRNGWVNNCDGGDLRRHRAHYDVIVMNYLETIFEIRDKDMKIAVSHCTLMCISVLFVFIKLVMKSKGETITIE